MTHHTTWEEEFDRQSFEERGMFSGGDPYGLRTEALKEFIGQVEASARADERKKIVEWVERNEYCSKCCSPKEFCTEWGKNVSAIDTKELLAALTEEDSA